MLIAPSNSSGGRKHQQDQFAREVGGVERAADAERQADQDERDGVRHPQTTDADTNEGRHQHQRDDGVSVISMSLAADSAAASSVCMSALLSKTGCRRSRRRHRREIRWWLLRAPPVRA
jgi:hypothetical protein